VPPVDATARLQCRHAAQCAGCGLPELDYAAQLAEKQAVVAGALRPYRAGPRGLSLELGAIVAAPSMLGYRARVKLVANGTALGLFARGSHDVVDIPDCQLSTPRVMAAVAEVRRRLPFEFALDGLDVREVDGGVLLTLIVPETASESAVDHAARALLAEARSVLGVSVSRRTPRSPRVLGGVPRLVAGVELAPHRLAPDEPYHLARAGAFVQAYPEQASRLYAAVEAALTARLGGLAGKRVVELFAGSGPLSLRLAARGAHVIAVDNHEPGIAALQRAAREQGLSLESRSAAAETTLLPELASDALIVDPPRRGLPPELRRAIAAHAPRVLAYVSCDPVTLARDLAHFSLLGYATINVTPFDLMPLTDSVETLSLLEPRPINALHPLFEDARVSVFDEPAHHGSDPDAPSGLRSTLEAAQARVQHTLLVRGVCHARGKLRGAPYRRRRVVGTHSLIELESASGATRGFRRELARIGHPLLGDTAFGDPRSNRFFFERYGLDRSFWHVTRLELASPELGFRSELAPDLAAVLGRLEAPAP
jgi:23S rRNA (uracil1939-C5)-methyltransferase